MQFVLSPDPYSLNLRSSISVESRRSNGQRWFEKSVSRRALLGRPGVALEGVALHGVAPRYL